MITIHRAAGFRVVIYTNDHEPAHVHVRDADGEAKINLLGRDGDPELVWIVGMKRAGVRRAMAMVAEHQSTFIAHWRSIHG